MSPTLQGRGSTDCVSNTYSNKQENTALPPTVTLSLPSLCSDQGKGKGKTETLAAWLQQE